MITYRLSLIYIYSYNIFKRSRFAFQCTHRKRLFCINICVFRQIIRFLPNKSLFLIQSTQVDSDIKKNSFFTHDNAVRAHYTCRDRFRSLPLFDGYMRLSPENSIIKINNTGFISPKTGGKNLTHFNVLRAGSFLDSKNDCGNRCRATVDFLRGKSVAFRGQKRGCRNQGMGAESVRAGHGQMEEIGIRPYGPWPGGQNQRLFMKGENRWDM